MKKIFTITFAMVALAISNSAIAQYTDVLNNQVNFEFQITNNYYGGGNDFDGQADPTMRSDLWLANYGWFGENCYTWDCSSTCTNQSNGIWYAGSNWAMDNDFSIWVEAFESDNSNECSYTSGDDHHYIGYASLRTGQTMPLIYPSTDFRPCAFNPWLAANGTPWLFQAVSEWDQVWSQTWRYSAGDESTNPLNFGTLSSGTVSDINATRSVSTESSSTALQYTNTSNYSSADVWYGFTLNAPSTVTISTDHGETDFDTHLRLYEESGTFIALDDDGGANASSVLTQTLCAGAYIFEVEGFSSNTGLFKVSVNVSSAGSPSVSSFEEYDVSCPGTTDGAADWSITGGVAPYTYQWNGSGVGSASQSGLGEGNYSMVATDACGTTTSQSFTIENGDATAPNAVCQNTIEINVWQGNTTNISVADINDGSTDNCSINNMYLSQGTFDVGDVGFNTVTLTVVDANGNSSECSCSVYALNTTGIEEDELTDNITVYPNPNHGTFRLDLSKADLLPNATVSIIDNTGRVVFNQSVKKGIEEISLNTIAPGTYLLKVNNDGVMASKRITIIK